MLRSFHTNRYIYKHWKLVHQPYLDLSYLVVKLINATQCQHCTLHLFQQLVVQMFNCLQLVRFMLGTWLEWSGIPFEVTFCYAHRKSKHLIVRFEVTCPYRQVTLFQSSSHTRVSRPYSSPRCTRVKRPNATKTVVLLNKIKRDHKSSGGDDFLPLPRPNNIHKVKSLRHGWKIEEKIHFCQSEICIY